MCSLYFYCIYIAGFISTFEVNAEPFITVPAAPVKKGMQKPDASRTTTVEDLSSRLPYTWTCNSDDTGTSALVGLDIGGKDVNVSTTHVCKYIPTLNGETRRNVQLPRYLHKTHLVTDS